MNQKLSPHCYLTDEKTVLEESDGSHVSQWGGSDSEPKFRKCSQSTFLQLVGFPSQYQDTQHQLACG